MWCNKLVKPPRCQLLFWPTLYVIAFLSACTKPSPVHEAAGESSIQSKPSKIAETLTFSAAASTKDLMTALIEEFRKASNCEVKLNVGASSTLANQIISGAPVDLFLSANEQWASEVEKAGLVSERIDLLTNRLVLVVPEANVATIHAPQDLSNSNVKKIALAGENVPAGIYAGQVLSKLNLLASLQSEGKIVRGQDVRTALSYVERGEADAGIVYSTDVLVAAGVNVVHEFDPTLHDEIVYVLVKLKDSNTKSSAREFYDFMQLEEAGSIFSRFGFRSVTRGAETPN